MIYGAISPLRLSEVCERHFSCKDYRHNNCEHGGCQPPGEGEVGGGEIFDEGY